MTAEMTFIISSGNLFGIVLIPVFGFVKDRVRRPYMIMTTLLAAGLLSVVFAFTKSTAVLFVLHGLIVGITSALNPIFENMAGDGKYRYGLVRIWGTIGFAVSSQVAALLLDIADPKWIFFVFLLSTVLSVSCFFCTGVSAQKSVKEKYPAVLRDLHLCAERYNGHTSGGAMIIEIGSNGNTLPEAIKCAQLVGECIVSLIKN